MATIKVALDTNPGPFLGRPIAPSGWLIFGSPANCAVNPADGSFFRQSDVVPDQPEEAGKVAATGTATLQSPPNGWQITDSGQSILSPLNQGVIAAAVKAATPAPLLPAPDPGVLTGGAFPTFRS